jgi:lysozyme family protein
MINFLKRVLPFLFKRQNVKAQDIIIVHKDNVSVAVPLPSVLIDNINDGSTRYPDFSYLYDNCKVYPSKELDNVVKKIISTANIYKEVERATGVPWELIAALNYRESSLDFKTYLGNGELLSRKTKLVPKGRGPFKTWSEGAIDALRYDKLDKKIINTPALMCAQAELFNGLGYRNKGIYSPYVWSGTSFYSTGKYTSDGIYNPIRRDSQLGVAAIIKGLIG